MTFTCPVCFYDKLAEAPENYSICVCCGTEFGNDDEFRSHAELRDDWIRSGCKWFFKQPPGDWNPHEQLKRGRISVQERELTLKARAG